MSKTESDNLVKRIKGTQNDALVMLEQRIAELEGRKKTPETGIVTGSENIEIFNDLKGHLQEVEDLLLLLQIENIKIQDRFGSAYPKGERIPTEKDINERLKEMEKRISFLASPKPPEIRGLEEKLQRLEARIEMRFMATHEPELKGVFSKIKDVEDRIDSLRKEFPRKSDFSTAMDDIRTKIKIMEQRPVYTSEGAKINVDEIVKEIKRSFDSRLGDIEKIVDDIRKYKGFSHELNSLQERIRMLEKRPLMTVKSGSIDMAGTIKDIMNTLRDYNKNTEKKLENERKQREKEFDGLRNEVRAVGKMKSAGMSSSLVDEIMHNIKGYTKRLEKKVDELSHQINELEKIKPQYAEQHESKPFFLRHGSKDKNIEHIDDKIKHLESEINEIKKHKIEAGGKIDTKEVSKYFSHIVDDKIKQFGAEVKDLNKHTMSELEDVVAKEFAIMDKRISEIERRFARKPREKIIERIITEKEKEEPYKPRLTDEVRKILTS